MNIFLFPVALSPQELDKETTAAALHKPDTDSEEDQENDDNIHDFSIALENLDDLILKLTQSQHRQSPSTPKNSADFNVPQVDGADDLLRTPTKTSKTSAVKASPHTPTTPKHRRQTMGSPCRSPRTPKTAHKYAPLPLVSINRSTGKGKCLKCNKNNNKFIYLKYFSASVVNSNDVTPSKNSGGDRNSL